MNETRVLRAEDNRLVFRALASASVFHGVFNRHGGGSPPPWDTRNVSFHLGDAAKIVHANRAAIKKTLGCNHLVSARQVHGAVIHRVEDCPEGDIEVDGADGLITSIRGLGLMIQQADCQAVMLFDPEKMGVGIAHAGWRGSVADIIAGTVSAMREAFATDPAHLIAAISPSLGPCCAEFVNYLSELPASLHGYQVRPNYFDFWAMSRDQLIGAGVRPGNIHIAGICTRCSPDYFSYRRDRETGRFASVIGVRK